MKLGWPAQPMPTQWAKVQMHAGLGQFSTIVIYLVVLILAQPKPKYWASSPAGLSPDFNKKTKKKVQKT